MIGWNAYGEPINGRRLVDGETRAYLRAPAVQVVGLLFMRPGKEAPALVRAILFGAVALVAFVVFVQLAVKVLQP
jgi:hypothetical protein